MGINFEGKEFCNGVILFFEKKKIKKTQPIHTPLFSSSRHKNEVCSLGISNLKASYGEGRWQNSPLDFQTMLVIHATEYLIENHITLTGTNRVTDTVFYFVFFLQVTRPSIYNDHILDLFKHLHHFVRMLPYR